jgi:hypothetical protein
MVKKIVVFSLILLFSNVVKAQTFLGSKEPAEDLMKDVANVKITPLSTHKELESSSSIAMLEYGLSNLRGSLISPFVSPEAQEKIEQEIAHHTELLSLEINLLADKVIAALEAKSAFEAKDALSVLAESTDSKNREAVFNHVNAIIFNKIRDFNKQASEAETLVERENLSTQRTILEQKEAAFLAAREEIIHVPSSAIPSNDVKLFRLISASSSSARTAVEAFALVGVVATVGTTVAATVKVLGFWK